MEVNMTKPVGGTANNLHTLSETKWWAKLSIDKSGVLVEKNLIFAYWDRLVIKDFSIKFKQAVKTFISKNRDGNLQEITNLAYRAGVLTKGIFEKRKTFQNRDALVSRLGIEILQNSSLSLPAASSQSSLLAPAQASKPSTLDNQKPNTQFIAAEAPVDAPSPVPLNAHQVQVIYTMPDLSKASEGAGVKEVAKAPEDANMQVGEKAAKDAKMQEIAKAAQEAMTQALAKSVAPQAEIPNIGADPIRDELDKDKVLEKYVGAGLQINRGPDGQLGVELDFLKKEEFEAARQALEKDLSEKMGRNVGLYRERFSEADRDDGHVYYIQLSHEETAHLLGYRDKEGEFSRLIDKCWEEQGREEGTTQLSFVSPAHNIDEIQKRIDRYQAGFKIIRGPKKSFQLQLVFDKEKTYNTNLGLLERDLTRLFRGEQRDLRKPDDQKWRFRQDEDGLIYLTLTSNESFHLLDFSPEILGTVEERNAAFDKLMSECEKAANEVVPAAIPPFETVRAAFAKVDSTKLLDTELQFGNWPRGHFHAAHAAGKWSTYAPVFGVSGCVSDNMLKHTMSNKKDSALGVKYVKGDKITNMEGALESLYTPIYLVHATGDMHWYGGSGWDKGVKFKNQLRQVVVSAAIHPDFEISNLSQVDRGEVTMPLVRLTDKGFKKGNEPPKEPEMISAKDKEDDEKRRAYDEELRKLALHHLTANGLPALGPDRKPPLEKGKPLLAEDNVLKELEKLIEADAKGQDLRQVMQNQFLEIGRDIISLEVLFNIYIEQIKNEFAVLENILPQGYIYTISPPQIYAKQLEEAGGKLLLNRLQLLAFKCLANSPERDKLFKHLKVFAISDFGDQNIVQLYEMMMKGAEISAPVVSNDALFDKDDKGYSAGFKNAITYNGKQESLEGLALVRHLNGDQFGRNEKNEGLMSLHGLWGVYSDCSLVSEPDRPDLTAYVIRP